MQQGFSKPSVVRQIPPHIIQEKLNEDLDSLLQLALTGGASEATIISSADVIFDREKRSRANSNEKWCRACYNRITVLRTSCNQMPEDMGNAVVFLVSDEAKEITGQALNVCGGMKMN